MQYALNRYCRRLSLKSDLEKLTVSSGFRVKHDDVDSIVNTACWAAASTPSVSKSFLGHGTRTLRKGDPWATRGTEERSRWFNRNEEV